MCHHPTGPAGAHRRGVGRMLAALALLALPSIASAAEIAISCGAIGRELELCREGAEEWAARTGNTVRIVSTPNDANARFALYQQLLTAGSAEVDVLQIDVIWPAALAPHLLDLTPLVPQDEVATHLPALIANNTIDNRLVAMPWFVDVGLLYYRRDLLEKHGATLPDTWAELTATAERILAAERAAGNDRLWGLVFQGRSYEGLTCNALEWVASAGGGRILADDGTPTIANPQAAAALDLARSWIGRIAPPGVLNYAEEDARGVFQSGNAIFMRNWPYARALAEAADSPVKGKVDVAPLPGGMGTLGGAELAVSRYAKDPKLAADLVRHLAGRAEQKRRALAGSFAPTIPGLYDDAELRRAHPFLAPMRDAIAKAVARPVREAGGRYNQVSSAFWLAAHATLSGEGAAARNLDGLAARLRRQAGRR